MNTPFEIDPYTNKRRMKKLKIKVLSPKHSEQVQKALFRLGYTWANDNQTIKFTEHSYLYTSSYSDGIITRGDAENIFNDRTNHQAVTLEDLHTMLHNPESHVPITGWTMKLSHPNAFDPIDVAENLSRNQPLALIHGTAGNNFQLSAAIIHRSIMGKAETCQIDLPDCAQSIRYLPDGSATMAFDIAKTGEIVKWVRTLRHMKWPDHGVRDPKIKVTLPTI